MTNVRRYLPAVAAWALAAVLILRAMPADAQILTPTGPGPNNDITDVPGVQLGHFTDVPARTGVTVLFAPDGAVGGVDVRGGWPTTVETDLLDPRNLVHRLNAIVLTGGGPFGLAARTGVMRCLEEEGEGFAVGTPDQVVPIVPGAAVEDFARTDTSSGPSDDDGYAACQAAVAGGSVQQGSVGAGTGAVAGGVKGGFGTASAALGNGLFVGAAVVVNSLGKAWRPSTCRLNVDYLELADEFGGVSIPPAACAGVGVGTPQIVGNAIGVVATNFALDKAQTQKMAGIAQDGLARAITPSHTTFDGDVTFGMATGSVQAVGECLANTPSLVPTVCALVLNDIFAAAADTVSRAVVHALLNADTVGSITSFCDTFSVCGSAAAAGATQKDRTPVRPELRLPERIPVPQGKPVELMGAGAFALLGFLRVRGVRRFQKATQRVRGESR